MQNAILLSSEIELTEHDRLICQEAFEGMERTNGYPNDSEIVCLSFGYAEVLNDGMVVAFGKIVHECK